MARAKARRSTDKRRSRPSTLAHQETDRDRGRQERVLLVLLTSGEKPVVDRDRESGSRGGFY